MILDDVGQPVGDGSPPLPPGCVALTMDPSLLDLRSSRLTRALQTPPADTVRRRCSDVATVGGLALSAGPSVMPARPRARLHPGLVRHLIRPSGLSVRGAARAALGSREASIAIGELVIDVAGALVVVIVTVARWCGRCAVSQVDQLPHTARRSPGGDLVRRLRQQAADRLALYVGEVLV